MIRRYINENGDTVGTHNPDTHKRINTLVLVGVTIILVVIALVIA